MHNDTPQALPDCTEAEMSLLGCMILEPTVAGEVPRYVTGKDFSHTKHQVIYDALQAIAKDTKEQTGTPEYDLTQLVTYLRVKETLELCGGESYMLALANGVAVHTSWPNYARTVRNHAAVRRLCELCEQVVFKARAGSFATSAETEQFLGRASRYFAKATAPLPDPNLILESGKSVVEERLEQIASGKIHNVGTPWPDIDYFTQPFLPGSVVVLSGEPGSAKSFFVLQMVSHMIEHGIDADLLALESGRTYHLTRRLAQVSGVSDITLVAWVASHPEQAKALHAQHAEHLELIGQHIFEAKAITYRGVVDWVSTRMKAGARLVVVDPITIASREGRKVDEADLDLMNELKDLAKEHWASVLLVTHPPKLSAGDRKASPHQNDMAGGAAFSRFSMANFTLARHSKPREAKVYIQGGDTDIVASHYLYIGKARDGSRSGLFALNLDPQSITFKYGLLVKEDIGEYMENTQ
jgi:replicative DNA helicase